MNRAARQAVQAEQRRLDHLVGLEGALARAVMDARYRLEKLGVDVEVWEDGAGRYVLRPV